MILQMKGWAIERSAKGGEAWAYGRHTSDSAAAADKSTKRR
jgi:hypothetical protein